MFSKLLLFIYLINITTTSPVKIKEYKVYGDEGASLGKFISDYINKKVPQTWMDDETDFDIFNIVGKYENFEDLDGGRYDSSVPNDSESQDGEYVAIGHEVERPTWMHGAKKPTENTPRAIWADALLEPLLNYSRLLKKLKDSGQLKQNMDNIEKKQEQLALSMSLQPSEVEEREEVSFSDLYQPKDRRRKRFAPMQLYNESVNLPNSIQMPFATGMSQMSMPMSDQYHMSMQMMVPMPMPVPVPIPVPVPPYIVPGRSYFEPVIHDHPHPSKIKQIIEQDKRKYALSGSRESKENNNNDSIDECDD